MLTFTDISLGEGGALTCTRCAPPQPAAYRATSEVLGEIDRAVAGWIHGGSPNVSFVGAEPFNQPDLPEVIAHAVRAGVSRVRLETDANALGFHDNARGSFAAGVRHVRVRLLGDPELHDSLASEPGLYEAALSGLDAFRTAAEEAAARVFVSAFVPVGEHNFRNLPSLVAELAKAGIMEAVLSVNPGFDPVRAAPWIGAACDTGIVNRVWVSVEGIPQEHLGERRLHCVRLAGAGEAQ